MLNFPLCAIVRVATVQTGVFEDKYEVALERVKMEKGMKNDCAKLDIYLLYTIFDRITYTG